MRKEMNTRLAFYLLSIVTIGMLILIYMDVRELRRDVDQIMGTMSTEIITDNLE